MKDTPSLRTFLMILALGIAAGVVVLKTQSQVRTITAADRISNGMFFGQRIVEIGPQPATEEESQIL